AALRRSRAMRRVRTRRRRPVPRRVHRRAVCRAVRGPSAGRRTDARHAESSRRLTMRFANELFVLVFVSVLAGLITGQWLIGASLPVPWSGWRFLRLHDGPPVLAFAMTYHWGMNVVGLFYHSATGRKPLAMQAPMYGEMVIIGLVCIALMVAGIVAGDAL